MSSVHTACTPINSPKDSQKYGIYSNEEGMYEIVFSSQQPEAKDFRNTAAMCCFVMFDSSLVITHMRWKLKVLQAVSRPLRLQMRPIDKPLKKKTQQLPCSMMT